MYFDLEKQVELLEDKLEVANFKITELEEELGDMREAGTPRPDWRRCGHFVEGGDTRWTRLMVGKSSNQLMDILLDDIEYIRYLNLL